MIKIGHLPKLQKFWKEIEVSDCISKSLSQPNRWCPSPSIFFHMLNLSKHNSELVILGKKSCKTKTALIGILYTNGKYNKLKYRFFIFYNLDGRKKLRFVFVRSSKFENLCHEKVIFHPLNIYLYEE